MDSTAIDPRYPRVGQGRRMVGLLIDWALCYFITWGFFADPGTSAFTPIVYFLYLASTSSSAFLAGLRQDIGLSD